MTLIFVDCEAYGPCPALGRLTEFGAVEFETGKSYHGKIIETKPDSKIPAIPVPVRDYNQEEYYDLSAAVFVDFSGWLTQFPKYLSFVSDNPAYDWQWINQGLHMYTGDNPFGYSARRIGDFWAGLNNNFKDQSKWKKLRVTSHDHNPINDCRGNIEAVKRMLKGER